MKNAAETVYQKDEDEEGVAEGAASLGADGGPTFDTAGEDDDFDSDLDVLADDDSWLEEELSEEELAALSEEGFADEELDDVDFGGEEIAAAEFEDAELSAEEFLSDDIDASFDDEIGADAGEFEYSAEDETGLEDSDAAAEQPVPPETAETSGALVTAAGVAMEEGSYGDEMTEFGEADVDHRPVPRISIHAFCETPLTTALLEKASVDRRLSKAHLTIHMGGLSKAIDQFQSASTPNLIILESLATGAEIFAQLGELAEVCDPSTKVVIVGHVNDIILYRELIRQGVSEYIVRPQSPLQIIKTIADLYVDPAAPPIGRTIAFVGSRGGVGSSSIAHNIGWCTSEEYQSDTVILDLDLPFGTASLDFDQEASAGLVEALTAPERLDDVLLDRLLQKHTEHLSLFTAPSLLDREFDIDDQAFETVLDTVRGSAPTVIVDVPHVWTSWSKRILTTADEIVVTATPDLASFRNTKQLVDILSSARPNDSPPTLVLNQVDAKLSAVQPDQFEEHVGIKPAQVIAWEPQLFGAAATNAAPIVDVGPRTKTATALRELASQLLGRNEANIGRPKFSLVGMFKKKR